MKKKIFILFSLFLLLPSYVCAEDFLGIQLNDQEKREIISKTESHIEYKATLSHDEVVKYYRELLKECTGIEDKIKLDQCKNIKIREWKNATYIEDDGKQEWHSVTISKGDQPTTVKIVKDNFTWIIGTLVLRYIAVFTVLMILFVGMAISGAIISRSIKKAEEEKSAK
jgi:hypothetical protein